MISKRSNTASAKGRDIAPGIPAQKDRAMEEFVRVPDGTGLSSLRDGAASASPPEASIPSRAGEPKRKVWPLGGYAPGNYMGRCRDCGAQFDGDKRAMICLECAVIGANARIAATEATLSHVTAVEGRLRIALWNEMRRAGVAQEVAIEMIREIASGTEAHRVETGTGSIHDGPVGDSRDAQGDAA